VANTKEEHLAKAEENINFLRSIDLNHPGALAWSITILFYAALHYVEAYFVSKRGFGCKHHFSRATEIQRDPKINSIFNDYAALENLSREARYDVSCFNEEDLKRANTCFENIKSAIESLL
jgi:hypothetical protein